MKIGVIGSGKLGTAIANIFALVNNQQNLYIYLRCNQILEQINKSHLNQNYYPNLPLQQNIVATNNLKTLMLNTEIIFICLPSIALEQIFNQIAICCHYLKNKHQFVICSKGFSKNGEFFDQLAQEILDNKQIFCMLGPSFAEELIHNVQTYVNLVGTQTEQAFSISKQLNNLKTNLHFIPHENNQGAQILSVMKNIAAIYMGILKGYGMAEDFCAAFFTFFITEIKIILNQLAIKDDIIFSLSGIGDLFLTCISKQSRNFSFGHCISQIKLQNKDEYLIINEKFFDNHHLKLPEGYFGLQNLLKIPPIKDLFINNQIPLCQNLYNFLFQQSDIKSLLNIKPN